MGGIFIKYLKIGFQKADSAILNENITPYFNKLNTIKEHIFEAIEKIYVMDPG